MHFMDRETEYHFIRITAANHIMDAIEAYTTNYPEKAQQIIADVITQLSDSPSVNCPDPDPRALGILEDLKGQVSIALSQPFYFSRQLFNSLSYLSSLFFLTLFLLFRWGRHYLLSLARAHHLQICSNFKDPGVQFYGGPLFKSLRYNIKQNNIYGMIIKTFNEGIKQNKFTCHCPLQNHQRE